MSILNISILHELANHFTVKSKADCRKLYELISSVDDYKDSDWQQGELFVVVKHYRDTPERDEPTRMLYAANYQDARSRCAFLVDADKKDADFTHKLYQVCSLDGWNGSDVGAIKVIGGKVVFVTDYAKLALMAFVSSDQPNQTLSVLRKQSGRVQVFYAGYLWAEALSTGEALAQVGRQLDEFTVKLKRKKRK